MLALDLLGFMRRLHKTERMSTVPNKIIYSMIGVGKYYDKKAVLKDIYLS